MTLDQGGVITADGWAKGSSGGPRPQRGGTLDLGAAGPLGVTGALDVSGDENWIMWGGAHQRSGASITLVAMDLTLASGSVLRADSSNRPGVRHGGSVTLHVYDHLAMHGQVSANNPRRPSLAGEILLTYCTKDLGSAIVIPPGAVTQEEQCPGLIAHQTSLILFRLS